MISRFLRKRIENPDSISKYDHELSFWQSFLTDLQKWFKGELKELFGTPPPSKSQVIETGVELFDILLTWKSVHQEVKYAKDLRLETGAFNDCKLLDIGAGPIPSGEVFQNCELYNLDPLLSDYIKIGYPIHIYGSSKFCQGHAENMPFPDSYFDAVISVNAIDHVDNFRKVASEIGRVLKPGGRIRMHIHYHPPTKTEPIVLSDEVVLAAFDWCKSLEKIHESDRKTGYVAPLGEKFVLWGNF